MIPRTHLLTICFLSAFSTFANAAKVDFRTSLSTGKQQAAQEGKLYFIDFVASWCMPCRWMDETTFSDQQVSDYINANYIPIKVDIDDFDGFALKQQYNIKLLPTILVFDSQGKLLSRYEESLAPSKMLQILKQHNTPKNRVRNNTAPIVPAMVTGQEDRIPTTPPSAGHYENEQVVSRPPLGTTKPNNSVRPPVRPPIRPPAATRPTTSNNTTVASGDGLFKFSVERMPSVGYSVQIGAFGEYGNVLREVAKLEEQYDQPVIVHIAQLNGNTVYKVLLGSFVDRNKAIAFQQLLKKRSVVGIIKDLKTMK